MRSGGHGPLSMRDCGLGWNAIVIESRDRSLVKQTRTGEKNSKFCVFGYPLSESVAPPGTAWDAEGLRGNEANENKINGTRPRAGAQGASGSLLHRRTWLSGSAAFGHRASARSVARKNQHEKRSTDQRSAFCPVLVPHVESERKGRIGVGDRGTAVGAPVVALIVMI